jgi:hypothetical protein
MLSYAQRTLARQVFREIQRRNWHSPRLKYCPGCDLSFEDSPDCKLHPGLCCMCVDVVAKIEGRKISHEARDDSPE